MEFNKALEHTASLFPPVAAPHSILPYKAEKRTAKRGKSSLFLVTKWNNGENWTACSRGEQAWKSHGLGRDRKFSVSEVWSWYAYPKQVT